MTTYDMPAGSLTAALFARTRAHGMPPTRITPVPPRLCAGADAPLQRSGLPATGTAPATDEKSVLLRSTTSHLAFQSTAVGTATVLAPTGDDLPRAWSPPV